MTRRSPLKRKRSTPRRSSRVRDPEFMERVRQLPCLCTVMGLVWDVNVPWPTTVVCGGPIHAHHMGERGFGQKASDDTCVSLCMLHHAAWHDARGPFLGWSKEARRTFAQAAIRWTQEKLGHDE